MIGEKFKLLIDVKNPKTDWDSEYTMMKQNTNVMFELFYTLGVVGIIMIVSNLINSIEIFWIVMILLAIMSNIILDRYLSKRNLELKKIS